LEHRDEYLLRGRRLHQQQHFTVCCLVIVLYFQQI